MTKQLEVMESPAPMITVGVPVYNGERFLERAIRSLQQQDYPNFEIVISDNCSIDRTAEICHRLVAEDKRIRYHVNSANIGAVPNFAQVFSLAKGEYFMWAAYDDLWDRQCLSALVAELLPHPEAGLAHSGLVLMDETGQVLSEKKFLDEDNPNHWSCTDTALRCVSPARGRPKLNFAMYGLFRTETLRRAIPYVCDVAMWDRLFVVLVAMITSFRYCSRPLYMRTLQNTRADERYVEDAYARQVRANRWWRAKTVVDLAAMLLRCPHIPINRKLVVPKIVWRFGLNQWRKKKDPDKKRRRGVALKVR